MTHINKENSEKGPLAWMAGHRVASNILMIVLLLGGLVFASKIKQEVFPEFDMGIVRVSVGYPGASPEEVERGIVLAIEEAVNGVDGIDQIRSSAGEGYASVTVDVIEGYDLEAIARDIESRVDSISTFPDEAETPSIYVPTRKREVLSYAIHGDYDESVLREKGEEIRDILLQNPQITQVELDGIRGLEIQVDVPQENLRRYGITIGEVASRIRSASVELPGGSIKTDGGEILVRISQKYDLAREYYNVPIITHEDGSRVLLGEIANIREGFTDSDSYATFNGKPSIMVEIYRVGDQKPIEVAEAAKLSVEEFREGLPEGIGISLVRDMSEIFAQRADLLLKNGYLGLCLVFICLALFLEIRLAFWVSMGIPISFLGAFLIFPLTDFSINMVSMFAFIVTLGIVVDDAIVVGENIYSQRDEGVPFLEAAVMGTKEIARPVTFSVLTNIVAFMPLFFVPGRMGKIFGLIPVVVISVFAISLVESLLILPAHLSHSRKVSPGGLMGGIDRFQRRFSDWFGKSIRKYYGPFLKFTLKHRYTVLAVGIALLFITYGYVMSGRMGLTLFPTVESDYAYAKVNMPYGTSLSRTEAAQRQLVESAKKVVEEYGGDELSEGIFARVHENTTYVRIFLTPPEIRPASTAEVTKKWREAFGDFPGAENVIFQSDRGGPGSGRALNVELSHRNIAILDRASEDLAKELSFFPKVKDIDDGSARGKRQFDFKMLPEGERIGFNALDVGRQVRHAFYGAESLTLLRGRNEVKVMVRLPEEERESEYALEDLVVRRPDGTEALLREVVEMKSGRAYTEINRRSGRRIVEVEANVIPRPETNTVITALKADTLPTLIGKYPGLTFSFEGRHADMKESVSTLLTGLLIAIICIYALLAIPFRSYYQPLIIMACIPFGMIGVVIGHTIMGYSLSVISLFGVVALSGVVVNDSLILVDFANRSRDTGIKTVDAVCYAGIQRFRPIILTTLTTFGGLAPMIFETSRQARFMIPMAISLGFGILFATFITLILVPTLYMVAEDIADLFREESLGRGYLRGGEGEAGRRGEEGF